MLFKRRNLAIKCHLSNHWYNQMNTQGSAGARQDEHSCVDKQDHFVKSMSELVKIAIDNNDLRRQVAVHEGRLTAHESRIVVIEVSQVDNTADLHKILQHLESSLSVENQAKILGYIEKFETNKDRAIKYYIGGTMLLFGGVMIGIPFSDVFEFVGKVAVKVFL